MDSKYEVIVTERAKQELKAAKSLNARERNILRPEGEVIGIRYGSAEWERKLRVDMSDEIEESSS